MNVWKSDGHLRGISRKKCIFSFGAKQKSPIHTIDGCLKYLKGGKLPKVSQTLTMFAGDDEVGKFDF